MSEGELPAHVIGEEVHILLSGGETNNANHATTTLLLDQTCAPQSSSYTTTPSANESATCNEDTSLNDDIWEELTNILTQQEQVTSIEEETHLKQQHANSSMMQSTSSPSSNIRISTINKCKSKTQTSINHVNRKSNSATPSTDTCDFEEACHASTSDSMHVTSSTKRKKMKNNEEVQNKKCKKQQYGDEIDFSQGQLDSGSVVKKISSSATYLELCPSGNSQRIIYLSIYTSKRNQYGPTQNDKLDFLKRMKIEATVKPDEISYMNLKGFISKQNILKEAETKKSKLSIWVKFDNYDEYFFLFCQTGKGNQPPLNMITFDENDILTGHRHVNLNRYSSYYVIPTCSFIE